MSKPRLSSPDRPSPLSLQVGVVFIGPLVFMPFVSTHYVFIVILRDFIRRCSASSFICLYIYICVYVYNNVYKHKNTYIHILLKLSLINWLIDFYAQNLLKLGIKVFSLSHVHSRFPSNFFYLWMYECYYYFNYLFNFSNYNAIKLFSFPPSLQSNGYQTLK